MKNVKTFLHLCAKHILNACRNSHNNVCIESLQYIQRRGQRRFEWMTDLPINTPRNDKENTQKAQISVVIWPSFSLANYLSEVVVVVVIVSTYAMLMSDSVHRRFNLWEIIPLWFHSQLTLWSTTVSGLWSYIVNCLFKLLWCVLMHCRPDLVS